MAKRFSTKMHGQWVRNKQSGEVGRISYYDRRTELVWVIWEPVRPQKMWGASGVPTSQLLKIKGYDREPFFPKLRKVSHATE